MISQKQAKDMISQQQENQVCAQDSNTSIQQIDYITNQGYFWRLAVDLKKQVPATTEEQRYNFFLNGLTGKQEYQLGWVGYENEEPGTIQAIFLCFEQFIIGGYEEKLSWEYIKKAHQSIIPKSFVVKSTQKESQISYFGGSKILKYINNKSASEEYLSKLSKLFYNKLQDSTKIDVKKLLVEDLPVLLINPAKNAPLKYIVLRDSQNIILNQLKNNQIKYLSELFISEYEKNISTVTTQEEKLDAIVNLISRLEIVHPFEDCNCRLLVTLLLNKELIRNGFAPVILDDPNDFDFLPPELLKQEIIEGQKNFKYLLEHGKPCEKSLFNEEILKYIFSEKNLFYHKHPKFESFAQIKEGSYPSLLNLKDVLNFLNPHLISNPNHPNKQALQQQTLEQIKSSKELPVQVFIALFLAEETDVSYVNKVNSVGDKYGAVINEMKLHGVNSDVIKHHIDSYREFGNCKNANQIFDKIVDLRKQNFENYDIEKHYAYKKVKQISNNLQLTNNIESILTNNIKSLFQSKYYEELSGLFKQVEYAGNQYFDSKEHLDYPN